MTLANFCPSNLTNSEKICIRRPWEKNIHGGLKCVLTKRYDYFPTENRQFSLIIFGIFAISLQ